MSGNTEKIREGLDYTLFFILYILSTLENNTISKTETIIAQYHTLKDSIEKLARHKRSRNFNVSENTRTQTCVTSDDDRKNH